MATLYSPLGHISGSVGKVTFARTGAGNVVKQKIARNTSATPAQKEQRTRWRYLTLIGRTLGRALRVGYSGKKPSPHAQFMAANQAQATVDAQYRVTVDSAGLQLSKQGNGVGPVVVESLRVSGPDAVTVRLASVVDAGEYLGTDLVHCWVYNVKRWRLHGPVAYHRWQLVGGRDVVVEVPQADEAGAGQLVAYALPAWVGRIGATVGKVL